MASASQQLADAALSIDYQGIPPEVIERAKLHLLDVLGCGLAAHALGAGSEARSVMAEMGGADDAATIGLTERLPAANAAFANAMLCHALDFDDTHAGSVSHITVVVSPSALAACQKHAATGRDFLAALVMGYEVSARLGLAAAGAFHERGFHPTPICGVFGATAAASKVAGLDANQLAQAFGIAGSMASGIFEYLADGSSTKRMHPGWAAHAGLVASALAVKGATGPKSVLEGRFGLYATHLGRSVALQPQVADLGERWELKRTSIKRYPACHYIHGALGALCELLALHDVGADQIEEIVAVVPEGAVPIVAEPKEHKHKPRSDYEAKFSLQYSLAAQMVHRRSDLQIYSDQALQDTRTLELAKRVSYETKAYDTYPGSFPGAVRLHTSDARTLEAELTHQPGSPENPLPEDQIRQKFRANARLALAEADAHALEASIDGLDESDDLESIGAVLSLAETSHELAI